MRKKRKGGMRFSVIVSLSTVISLLVTLFTGVLAFIRFGLYNVVILSCIVEFVIVFILMTVLLLVISRFDSENKKGENKKTGNKKQ